MNNTEYAFYVHSKPAIPRRLKRALMELAISGNPIEKWVARQFIEDAVFLWGLGFGDLTLAICSIGELAEAAVFSKELLRLLSGYEQPLQNYILHEMVVGSSEFCRIARAGNVDLLYDKLVDIILNYSASMGPGGPGAAH